jgi:hypothetical protein
MLFLLLSVSALECDISLTSGVCIYDGQNVVRPYSTIPGLKGYWTFDDASSLDYSGSLNHGLSAVTAGHSPSGRGASSRFQGSSLIEVPSSASLSSKVFSLTFFLFLEQEETINQTGLRWCPILQKGDDDEGAKQFQRTPAVLLDRELRKIRVYVSTSQNEDYPEGEFIESIARIPYERWTHVAIIRGTKSLTLYVNGLLDTKNTTEGMTDPNSAPLYFGGTPGKIEECPVPFLLDEVRYYSRELKEQEIFSEAQSTLGQIEPRFVTLGCVECGLEKASLACDTGYHLCTTIELHAGAYSAAESVGWTEVSPMVWSYSALQEDFDPSVKGLGLCCLDLGY